MAAGFGWWGFRKLKAGKASSWILHMAYWHLPSSFTGLKAMPPYGMLYRILGYDLVRLMALKDPSLHDLLQPKGS